MSLQTQQDSIGASPLVSNSKTAAPLACLVPAAQTALRHAEILRLFGAGALPGDTYDSHFQGFALPKHQARQAGPWHDFKVPSSQTNPP